MRSMFSMPTRSPWEDGKPPRGLPAVPVMVSGTRTFSDYDLFAEKMDRLTFWLEHMELVVGSVGHMDRDGGWRGADYLARVWAGRLWMTQKIFHADWSLGRKAGPVSNTEMLDYLLKHDRALCVCWWDGKSPGTADVIRKARRRLPKGWLKVFKYREE